MTKPFNPRELVARVRAILRRTSPTSRPTENDQPIRVGDLIIDPSRYEARVGDRILPLRSKEFDLLRALAENRGLVLSREKLLNLVWGFDFYGQTRTVDVHVAHVRARLQKVGSTVIIETVWGVGYKLIDA
jgi:DNA-binding response OmpR family regulator